MFFHTNASRDGWSFFLRIPSNFPVGKCPALALPSQLRLIMSSIGCNMKMVPLAVSCVVFNGRQYCLRCHTSWSSFNSSLSCTWYEISKYLFSPYIARWSKIERSILFSSILNGQSVLIRFSAFCISWLSPFDETRLSTRMHLRYFSTACCADHKNWDGRCARYIARAPM